MNTLYCAKNKLSILSCCGFALHCIPECIYLLWRPLLLFTPSLLKTLAYYNVTAHQLVNHFSHSCTWIVMQVCFYHCVSCSCVCAVSLQADIVLQVCKCVCLGRNYCMSVLMCPVSVKLFSDLQTSRHREADPADVEAEDGLSSLGSELWAAHECCWVSVGLGSVKTTPGLDNKVSHIIYRPTVFLYVLIYILKYQSMITPKKKKKNLNQAET